MPTPTDNERTALYRLYDLDDRLLYVGITTDPRGRLKQHAADKPWWSQVATRELEWFDSRHAASAAEVAAIRTEHPKYNHQHRRSAALALLPPTEPALRPHLEQVTRDGRQADQRMASELRALIMAGEISAGDQLPTTADLQERFGISNVTVQRGLRQLKAEGFAVGQNGRGVFATAPTPPGMDDPQVVVTRILSSAEATPPRAVRKSLNVLRGLVIREEAVTEVDGWPVRLIYSYRASAAEPASVLSHTDQITARMPTGAELVALNLPLDVPILRTYRVSRIADGRPVQVEVFIEPAHLCQLDYEVPERSNDD